MVSHRDRLDGDLAAGGEQRVDRGEVRGPVLLADGLDHLDADDRVVLAGGLAVVDQLQVDQVPTRAGLREPLPGQRGLLGGDRDGGDRAPRWAARIGECAPAAADLEHPGAPATSAWSRMPSILRSCAASRSSSALLEPGRGVGHRGVEELARTGRWTGRSAPDVLARAVEELRVRGAAACRRTPAASAAGRDDRGEALGERGQQVGEVGVLAGRPVAGHVGLAEADLGVGAEAGEEGLGADDLHLGRVRSAGAPGLAVGERQAHGGAAGGRLEDRRGDPGLERRAGRAGDAGPAVGGDVSHCVPSWGWCAGRGEMGSRRSHSQIPCIRISRLVRWVMSGM